MTMAMQFSRSALAFPPRLPCDQTACNENGSKRTSHGPRGTGARAGPAERLATLFSCERVKSSPDSRAPASLRSSWYPCDKPLSLTLDHAIFLFIAGIMGGAQNAVAGGGSFVSFPALLLSGVPPIPANATNTLALWTGAAASGGAYRNHLDVPTAVLVPLLATSADRRNRRSSSSAPNPAHTFMRVLPWLMLGAPCCSSSARHLARRRASSVGHDATVAAIVGASIFELVVAVYGGYFGGGMGIVNLAMLAAVGMTNIHAMNALKSILGSPSTAWPHWYSS